jgi:hypothetical protein
VPTKGSRDDGQHHVYEVEQALSLSDGALLRIVEAREGLENIEEGLEAIEAAEIVLWWRGGLRSGNVLVDVTSVLEQRVDIWVFGRLCRSYGRG